MKEAINSSYVFRISRSGVQWGWTTENRIWPDWFGSMTFKYAILKRGILVNHRDCLSLALSIAPITAGRGIIDPQLSSQLRFFQRSAVERVNTSCEGGLTLVLLLFVYDLLAEHRIRVILNLRSDILSFYDRRNGRHYLGHAIATAVVLYSVRA
jgi:hypothetical protein